MNQFRETYNHFKAALEDVDCSNYWEWMLISDDLKAVALYVNFYDQITLAWEKTKKPFIEEENAVSTLMQYLLKNVALIEKSKNRYTPNYMYKVAFNAFYPLGRIKRDIDNWVNHACQYDFDSENMRQFDECDDFDNRWYSESFIYHKLIVEDEYFTEEHDNLWKVIEASDTNTKRVVEFLLGGRKLGKKLHVKYPEIIAELRDKLKNFDSH